MRSVHRGAAAALLVLLAAAGAAAQCANFNYCVNQATCCTACSGTACTQCTAPATIVNGLVSSRQRLHVCMEGRRPRLLPCQRP